MKLLAIDGGGIRGIYASHVLERIQREFKTVFHSEFDLIAGTSTGSIIAAAIAFGIPISKVTELYREKGPSIFRPRKCTFGGMFAPRYSSEPLRAALVSLAKAARRHGSNDLRGQIINAMNRFGALKKLFGFNF